MKRESISAADAKMIDLVDYLEKLGYSPKHIRHHDYWFLSPFRKEATASFKINRQLNVWYDHGLGKGGSLIDFGILFHRCNVKEFLEKLSKEKSLNLPFQPHDNSSAGEKKKTLNPAGKITITSTQKIFNPNLIEYLNKRKIPIEIAWQNCCEVAFELYNKKHFAIGFKNDSGGFEIRNEYFKGSSSPKEPKLIKQKDAKELAVFEGFFSFLSFQTLRQLNSKEIPDLSTMQVEFLILNSLSFFEKSRQKMEQYATVHLFLDRDAMGMKCTSNALQWSAKYKDQSKFYNEFKDLNEYLVQSDGHRIKQSQHKGLRF